MRTVHFCRNAEIVNTQRAHVFYSGRVQGVGFRFATAQLARGFDVTGTVHNCPDGRVELVAEGPEAEVTAFLSAIEESDLAGFIKERQTRWQKPEGGLKGFRII